MASVTGTKAVVPVSNDHDGNSLEKGIDAKEPAVVNEKDSQSDIDGDNELLQDGVKRMRAITSAWTFQALIITYILYGSSLKDEF